MKFPVAPIEGGDLPFCHWLRPPAVPSQTRPSLAARTAQVRGFDKPCFTESVGTASSRKRSSLNGRDPDVALSILEEAGNKFARKAVRSRIYICPAAVDVNQAPVPRSDPHGAIAIAEHTPGVELPHRILEG